MHPSTRILAQSEDEAEATADEIVNVDVTCEAHGPLCDVIYDWTDNEALASIVAYLVSVPVKVAFIAIGALLLNKVARRAIARSMDKLAGATVDYGEGVVTERSVERAEYRATTITSLLRSTTAALIYGAAFILIMEVLGISLIPVIAGAGVLGLAVGFGAQSVVEDLLRGVFMLGEDQFGVGDRIDVGRVNGTVERVTLRTVVIRDPDGTLWHIPNSEIDSVANENQQSSRATVDIGVSYDTDLSRAIEVLKAGADELAESDRWRDHVTAAPEVKGVQSLGDAVDLRVIVWVTAGDRRQFERELRRALKEALDRAEVEMPNPSVDVWLREPAGAAA